MGGHSAWIVRMDRPPLAGDGLGLWDVELAGAKGIPGGLWFWAPLHVRLVEGCDGVVKALAASGVGGAG